jgi:cysteine synthase A
MKTLTTGMTGAIGQTRLLALQRMVPARGAQVWLKLELENPTGSMKDRMALAMVDAALASGRIQPGGTVVEYTGGSTGVSLAFACTLRGLSLKLVTSDVFSREKRDHMRALGAELVLVPSSSGGTNRALTMEMIETARRLSQAPGHGWMDQFNNCDVLPAYHLLASELASQVPGSIDAFAHMVGTCGSLRGIATGLRQSSPGIRIVAIEPAESPVLSGGDSGSHGIEGTGPGFAPPLWDASLADEIRQVSTDEAMAMARRLAREEGVFAGISTGANLVVALQLSRELGPGHNVVTLAVDSGMKYLSTPLFQGA